MTRPNKPKNPSSIDNSQKNLKKKKSKWRRRNLLWEVDVRADTLWAYLGRKAERITLESGDSVISGIPVVEAPEAQGAMLGVAQRNVVGALEGVSCDHSEAL